MIFQVVPILDKMLEFYKMPVNRERFNNYISMLQGNSKGDLDLPISGYNPMAKEHINQKIWELQELNAEEILQNVLDDINQSKLSNNSEIIKVVINIADDLKGGWTNHYTTDFDSKFKLNALVERNFCTPYFWTSENYSEELIVERIKEYAFRTVYWKNNPKLSILKDYVDQEQFVQSHVNQCVENLSDDLFALKTYFENHQNSVDYNRIFNFFYGDSICEKLNYPTFGVGNFTGFDFVKSIF